MISIHSKIIKTTAFILHMSISWDKIFGIKVFFLVILAIFGIGHYRGHLCFTNMHILLLFFTRPRAPRSNNIVYVYITCIRKWSDFLNVISFFKNTFLLSFNPVHIILTRIKRFEIWSFNPVHIIVPRIRKPRLDIWENCKVHWGPVWTVRRAFQTFKAQQIDFKECFKGCFKLTWCWIDFQQCTQCLLHFPLDKFCHIYEGCLKIPWTGTITFEVLSVFWLNLYTVSIISLSTRTQNFNCVSY